MDVRGPASKKKERGKGKGRKWVREGVVGGRGST